MIACIIAFIIIGGVAIGAVFLLGSMNMNPYIPNNTDWEDGTLFEFERTGEAIPDNITVNIDIEVGAILVDYIDDPDLTYAISIWVPNDTIDEYGNPTVSWASNSITIDYSVCAVNITLGTNATYTLELTTSTGAIAIDIDNGAKVGDITASTSTGALAISMSDDVVLVGAVTYDLETSTGSIALSVDLPSSAGGRFVGDTGTGSVNVTPLGWTAIASNVYETSDYDTATDTLTITATTGTGSIVANLS